MKISAEVRDALGKLIGHYGNATQLAKALGVAHTTVLAWMNGKADEISGDVWHDRLKPKLLPYLPSAFNQPPPAFNDAPPPAGSLAFVRKMQRPPPLRPIEEAILAKLKGMSEIQLAKLYSDIVYNLEQTQDSLAAERDSGYNSDRRKWLVFIPKTGDGADPELILARLKGVAAVDVVRQGRFDWKLVNWRLVPQAEASAFDDFLLFNFAQPAAYVVKELLPLFKPYAFVMETAMSTKPAELLKGAMEGWPFHVSPYHDAAYGEALSRS